MPRRKQPIASDSLSCETGSLRKKWKGRLPVALVFPNSYHLGMSNLGFQLVYGLANLNPDVVCERIFLPSGPTPPRSIESNRPLQDFSVILCSISFENDYTGLINLLRLGGINLYASERIHDQPLQAPASPLIIAGGVATLINPEPLAPYIDMFVIGEAEPVLPQLLAFLTDALEKTDRQTLLRRLAVEYAGCYVPNLYTIDYHSDGSIAEITAPADLPQRIKKVTVNAGETVGHSQILSSETEFDNIFLAELGRGCSRGCRFCAAGFVYRPPRLWRTEAIIKALEQRPPTVKRIGLLGMEMIKAKDIALLAGYLAREGCSLSFSSLRADILDEPLLKILAASDVKTATIAPDGASERLRRVINKGINEADILAAVEALSRIGINNIKLYCMLGLPTETWDDLAELLELVGKIKAIILKVGRGKGRLGQLVLSVNCFIPKAWTPFQFHPFESPALLKDKIVFLRKGLAGQANIKLIVDQPDKALFQAMLAKGDRRMGKILGYLGGGRNWRHVFKEHGIDPRDYALRPRNLSEIFPWEIIDHGIDRRYLWQEYQKALREKPTSSCDITRCQRCGVCGSDL